MPTSGSTAQSPDAFRADVERCAELLEGLGGRRPVGYRAPAFSITRDTPWAYEALCDLGFRYDSSQYDSPRIRRRIRPCARGAVPAGAALRTGDLGVPDQRLADPGASRPRRRRRVLARAARPGAAAGAPAGRRRERLPCALLPPVRARPATAAGDAAGGSDPEAAAARGLEAGTAQSGQEASRRASTCSSEGVPARQLRGGVWRSRRTVRISFEITFARRRPRLTLSTTRSTRFSGRFGRGCSAGGTSRSTSSAATRRRACSTSAAARHGSASWR